MTDSIKDLNNKVQKLLEKYYIEDNKEQLYEEIISIGCAYRLAHCL